MCFIDRTVRMTQFPDFIFHGDVLTISCEVGYSGLLAPEFIWYPTPDNSPLVGNTGSSVNSTIQVTAQAYPGSVPSYTCYVSFSGSVLPSADNQTSTAVRTAGELTRVCMRVYSFPTLYFLWLLSLKRYVMF